MHWQLGTQPDGRGFAAPLCRRSFRRLQCRAKTQRDQPVHRAGDAGDWPRPAFQYSKDVTEYLGRVNFGYVITVCSNAEENCPSTFLGVSKRLHWDLEDPASYVGSDEEILSKFRKVRDQIDERVRTWLTE